LWTRDDHSGRFACGTNILVNMPAAGEVGVSAARPRAQVENLTLHGSLGVQPGIRANTYSTPPGAANRRNRIEDFTFR
jgi:hypothetical protein